MFSVVPFLGQYWHPHVLGGAASGTVQLADDAWEFDNADVYAEKNWGRGSRSDGGGGRRKVSIDPTCASHSAAVS